jgi:hypothetical protein
MGRPTRNITTPAAIMAAMALAKPKALIVLAVDIGYEGLA